MSTRVDRKVMMSTSEKDENVATALEALGPTSEQVYAALVKMGIKGCQREASTCPVAVYLNQIFPDYLVTVGPASCTLIPKEASDVSWIGCRLPQSVRHFVGIFDSGMDYQDLKTEG